MMRTPEFLNRFRRDQDGIISIELLFAVPILLWTLMSTMIYFDAFKAQTISTRAALTVADMISREEQSLSPAYLNGTRNLLRSLSSVDEDPDFRLTIFRFRDAQNDVVINWGRRRGYDKNLTENELNTLFNDGRIPPMSDGEVAILLETSTMYRPIANTAFLGPLSNGGTDVNDEIEFTTFTIIKPRYSPAVCFDPTPNDLENGDTICQQ
ncbi:hypothetical protein SLH49_06815 [Cognatiyoonia sp. IB215446]|uniref:TadE/TadG family type IV pilus assembly protein n=1 Tax=Cognatiyoonia sp. IB215446 TaxID=3097355 RepID=UPI002A133F4E|nr:hypothetical protein [Cognatiyoonia sp. IB215446]MDX8347693.1 hypothetical protein [Cognatiyoonia sp. IB215446]